MALKAAIGLRNSRVKNVERIVDSSIVAEIRVEGKEGHAAIVVAVAPVIWPRPADTTVAHVLAKDRPNVSASSASSERNADRDLVV